jgi:hypothetical protein
MHRGSQVHRLARMETTRLTWPHDRRLFRRAPIVPRSLQTAMGIVGLLAFLVIGSTTWS